MRTIVCCILTRMRKWSIEHFESISTGSLIYFPRWIELWSLAWGTDWRRRFQAFEYVDGAAFGERECSIVFAWVLPSHPIFHVRCKLSSSFIIRRRFFAFDAFIGLFLDVNRKIRWLVLHLEISASRADCSWLVAYLACWIWLMV